MAASTHHVLATSWSAPTRHRHLATALALTGALLMGGAAWGQAPAGQTLKGRLQGSADVDHPVRGLAGQTLTVTLAKGSKAEFNVLRAGAPEAMFTSSVAGPHAQLRLPDDGDYTVRVFLMRSLARRNESTAYQITLDVAGTALPPLSAAQDALVPGTPFHARATLPCQAGGTTATCEAQVTRRGRDGTATLRLRSPQGLERRVLWVAGQAVASDTLLPLSTRREGDLLQLLLGADERYDLRDALLTGG